ncbi:MAG: DegT/DnrJ/EryC1/StrS family aminotransferase [Planctomycetota bacterium]
MKVPLLDLKRQWETIRDEVTKKVAATFEEQAFVLGSRVDEFEAQFADYCDTAGAVGVASGTDALLLALRALGVRDGEEVVTTPFTFFATAGAIVNAGGTPVFVDIDPATFNLDPDLVEDAITERTRAILPVHLFGQTADMDPLLDVAMRRGVAILEDAAQAVGALYHGQCAGRMGDLGAFSFFPSKNLGGAGDGGMIVGEDEDLLDHLRALRGHGTRDRIEYPEVGWNSRLDALQAAVLSVKLAKLDKWSEARRRHAAVYDEAFLPQEGVVPPVVLDGCTPIYNQYVIRAARRDDLKRHLADCGIGTAIYYPRPLHHQPCLPDAACPEADRACDEVLALPVFPELTGDEQQYVIEKIREFFAR